MQNCLRCGFKQWIKSGKMDKETNQPIWNCGRCGNPQSGDLPFIRQKPRELYLDVETSLTEIIGNFGGKVVGEYINPKLIGRPFFIICWSALWTDHPKKVYSGCVTSEEALAYSDKNIMAPLWDLMDRADIICGHNIKSFDDKVINTRFKVNGFADPLPSKRIDTLKIARRKYRFERNSLDYLCGLFGIKQKKQMGIEDWIAIKNGDGKTLQKMLSYNRGDVRNGAELLELLREGASPNFGMTRLPNEPKDRRFETVTQLDDIQADVSDLIMRYEE